MITFTRGIKFFELTNHLGNVLVTVTDVKTPTPKSGTPSQVGGYIANMVVATDYTPFGMIMQGRNYNNAAGEKYRYGFNGQEHDNAIKGTGNHFTAEFWEYDPRVGRRWNLDPVMKSYESPYAAFGNNPIWNVDPTGADTSKSNLSQQSIESAINKLKNLEEYTTWLKGSIEATKQSISVAKSGYAKALTAEFGFSFNPAGFMSELVFSAFFNGGKSNSDSWGEMLAADISRLGDQLNDFNKRLNDYESEVKGLKDVLTNSNSVTLNNGVTL